MHSSNDDRVHSATVQGQQLQRRRLRRLQPVDRPGAPTSPRKGDFDECQIDKSGRWLLVKENVDGKNGEDNRIIDLQSGAEQVFYDEEGAAGHSDMGYGYLVAEDNMYNAPGAVRVWQFGQDMNARRPGHAGLRDSRRGTAAASATSSHGNAQAGTPLNQQMVCSSNAYRDEPAARQRDRLLPARRLDEHAHRRAEHDRPQRVGRRQRRLLEAAEGQPRPDRRVLHLDEQHRARTAPTRSSSACPSRSWV